MEKTNGNCMRSLMKRIVEVGCGGEWLCWKEVIRETV